MGMTGDYDAPPVLPGLSHRTSKSLGLQGNSPHPPHRQSLTPKLAGPQGPIFQPRFLRRLLKYSPPGLLTLKHSHWVPLGQNRVSLQMGYPPAQSGASPQISSRTGEASSHRLGKLFHPMPGLCLPLRLDSPRTGLCSSCKWFTPRPTPTDRPPPKTRLCSPLRLVTSVPLDEPRKCFELFLWTKCPRDTLGNPSGWHAHTGPCSLISP